jgi:hypothetical protein
VRGQEEAGLNDDEMNVPLAVAAGLLVLLAGAHSYLGERYILVRLFRRDALPRLWGGTDFTRRTLRFAWHLTSVAWLGFAVLLARLSIVARDPMVARVVAVTFLVSGVAALIGSRGRHLSWIVFLAVAALAWYGAGR